MPITSASWVANTRAHRRARRAIRSREARWPACRRAGGADCKGLGVRRQSLFRLPVEKFSPAARVQRSWANVLSPAPPIPARSPMATWVT